MRKYLHFMAAIVLAWACASPAHHAGVPADGTDSPARIQELAKTDYEAAMKRAGEALRNGRLSAFTANELRARLTYQYTEDYASAAGYLRKALEQDEAKDPGIRSELLYHLTTILRNSRDFTALLATCAEGKECARQAGKPFEEYAFDFMAGNGLYDLGEEDTAFEMMRTALSKATAIASTEPEYGHLLYFTGQYINTLLEEKDYPAALSVCSAYEGLISRMESTFPGVDPSYIDRCRFYLDLHRAVCQSYLGEPEAASKTFGRALMRDYAGTSGGKSLLVEYYAASGEPDKILDLYRNELPYTDPDTVSRAYRFRIARLREAFANAGIPEKAREYQERYDILSRKIKAKEQAEGTLVGAAKYDTQRYRFQLEDTTRMLKKNQRLIFALIIVFALAIGILLLITQRKARQHSQETRALEKSLSAIRRQVSIIAGKELQTTAPEGHGAQQPASLKDLVEGQKLYLNKSLNRQTASGLLGKTAYEIDKMLEEIAPGISFPDYIKSLRIRHALELIGQNPDIPIAELADRSGFYSLRTFQRSFLAVTGKTPSEYAQTLKR